MDEREIRSQIAREIEEMEVKFFDLHLFYLSCYL